MLSISRQTSISAGAISRGPVSTGAPPLAYGLPLHPGDTITCDDADTWDRAGTSSYQWFRNGSPIPGSTEPDYVVSGDDFGSVIHCRATSTDAKGAGVRESESTGFIDFPQYANQDPEIWLNTDFGYYEMLNAPTWEQSPDTQTYQWLVNGNPVEGQTSPQFDGSPGSVNDTLQLQVTASTQWYTVSVYSNTIIL
jgi:hypothetical protein